MYRIKGQSEFNRWTISWRDLEDARDVLERCEAHAINTPEYRALAITAVILYARPFSRNERSNSAKAIPSLNIEWFKGLTADDLELHRRLRDTRNKVIAHSPSDQYPTSHNRDTGVISSSRAQFPDFAFRPERVLELLAKLIRECDRLRGDFIFEQRDTSGREING